MLVNLLLNFVYLIIIIINGGQMNLKQKLGKRIQELRKFQNITQEKLAEIVNMDITSLSKIETGRNYPQPDTLEKIASALSVDIERLFVFKSNFTKEDYIEAIYKNVDFIKNNEEKLKFLYTVISSLV